MRNGLAAGTRIGLVPTMGALHEGHASLVRRSVAENDITIVSLFVNPTQFGPNEDLARYPRDLEGDMRLLESLGVAIVFAPESSEIYPDPPSQILFGIRDLDKRLCGASRPGHMNGVVQVVTILFHIIRPGYAYFGLKDYQQCLIIEHLVRELHFSLVVVPCPIVREPDGLAMSSRNRYLSPEERQQALFLSHALSLAATQSTATGAIGEIRASVMALLPRYPLVRLDYFEVLDGHTLSPIARLDESSKPVAFVAAFLGTTRLIDNRVLGSSF